METLHILKSEPDAVTNELIQKISANDRIIQLDGENTEWSEVVQKILDHEKIICWW